MSLLSDRLAAADAEGRAALIGYLPAGYPSVDAGIAAMRAMVEGGCDAIEIGLPYSDPLMDGPTVQEAAEGALRAGTTIADVLRTVRAVANTGTPPLVMTYWNPVERYGADRLAKELAAAGGAGLITPDLIPEEAADWLTASDATGLDRVFLVAPSSTDERLAWTARHCRGFVYAASTMGVTGVRASVSTAAAQLVRRTKAVTSVPVCVGVGVSTPEQAAEVASYADGVIVGSAFVRRMLDSSTPEEGAAAVGALASELAAAVRRGRR